MSQWLNAFLILVMIVAVWPSVLYFVGEFIVPIKSVRFLGPAPKGSILTKRPLHPADAPVCMAKLIMLRHRIQQANARRSNQRILPLTSPNTQLYTHSRHRPVPSQGWIYQTNYAGRRWTASAR